jgi:hypothetical protein
VNAEQLRAALVGVLAAANGPTTTSAARIAITEHRGAHGRPVLAEEVYRPLLTLQRRGVRRVHDQPGRPAPGDLSHRHRRNEVSR